MSADQPTKVEQLYIQWVICSGARYGIVNQLLPDAFLSFLPLYYSLNKLPFFSSHIIVIIFVVISVVISAIF